MNLTLIIEVYNLVDLVIGCGVVITFLFGLCSVFLASVLSGKSSKKNFWSYRKNICARILNGFVSLNKILIYFSFFNHLLSLVCICYIFINNLMVWYCLSYISSTLRSSLYLFCCMQYSLWYNWRQFC